MSDRFAELKARQALTWGAAPFERLTETLADVHDALIAGLGLRSGEDWLDVASGTGPVAVRAARAGARVTGLDLAPALVATARRLAAAEGHAIRYEVGDCERLPYPAASFDVVASSFGTIFAPDHAAVAAELGRVRRPGGRLGLACWQPGGGAARLTEVVMSSPGSLRPGRRSWAELLRRVFAVDVLVCPRCAGPRRILGALTEPHAVRRLLAALGLAAEPPPPKTAPLAAIP